MLRVLLKLVPLRILLGKAISHTNGDIFKSKRISFDNYVMATVTNWDCPSQTQMYGHPVFGRS